MGLPDSYLRLPDLYQTWSRYLLGPTNPNLIFFTAQPTPTQYFVTAQPNPTQYFVTAQPTPTQYFVTAHYGSIKVSIKAEAGLDRVGWIRSSMVRGKIRLT